MKPSILYKEFLPQDVHFYFDSYVKVLGTMVPSGDQDKFVMQQALQKMLNQGITVFVAIDEEEDTIVGTVTLLIEQKLIRGCAKAAHIEDIYILASYQRQGIGKTFMEMLLERATQEGCYKIIGDTRDELVPRFEKFGFDSPERMVRKYLNFTPQ